MTIFSRASNAWSFARPKRVALGMTSLLLAGAMITACGGAPSPSNGGPAAAGGGTVTVGATLEPTSLDLTSQAGAAIPQVLLYNVYEGLVKIDQSDGSIKPLLAKEWTVSDDGRTYTFNLVDAKFHDGSPLVAEDVVWSFERVVAPDSTNPFKTQMEIVEKVEAPDEKTVVVTLKKPSNNWLFNMANQVGVVLKKDATDLDTKPIGTGPFRFADWNRGNSISLERNDDYWGDAAKVDKVVFRYITDANALNNAMLAGQLDILSNVQAPQLLEVFADNDKFEVVDGKTQGEVVLAMNNSKGPLAKKEVRQAIRHAIDKEALVKTAWSGYGTLIGSMVPPSDPWYEDRTGDFPYDPAKAKELLAQAGYPNGFSVTIDVPPPGYARASGQFVAAQLAEVGIQVKQSNVEFPQWLDKVFGQADYDLTIVAHVEPRDIVQYGNPDYYWRYNNPQVKQWLAEADAATDEARRDSLYKQVAEQISTDAASDWLFLLPNLEVISKGVTGFPQDALVLSFDMTQVEKNS